MPTIRVNDVELYYERHGAGEPLLFISGLGGHLGEIPHLIDSYRQHVDVVAYDNRGCGRSEKPAGEFTIAGFADDASVLIEALGLSPSRLERLAQRLRDDVRHHARQTSTAARVH